MAARVTAAEVKQLMDGCTITDAVVDIFILSANELVTAVLGTDTTIGTVLLKEIERWFTAHMLASTLHRTTSEEKLGDAAAKFTGKWGEKLSSTPYGQMVLVLDITGKMSLAGKMGASIYAVKGFDE